MRTIAWIAISVLTLALATSPASADDESAAGMIFIAAADIVVFGTAAASTVVNTVQIARWHGNKFWGCAGIGSGILIPITIEAFYQEDDPLAFVIGGGVAALGVWSLVLSLTHDETTVSGVQLTPALVRDGGDVETGLVMTSRF